ncbi:hypothetical protein V6N13_029560 [Hibiscus sabdariffa]
MSSSNIASLLLVLLVASCVLNSEAVKCRTMKDCRPECPHGGLCEVSSGHCICVPATKCVKNIDCLETCAGYKIRKCEAGLCFCQ